MLKAATFNKPDMVEDQVNYFVHFLNVYSRVAQVMCVLAGCNVCDIFYIMVFSFL